LDYNLSPRLAEALDAHLLSSTKSQRYAIGFADFADIPR
jgi:hypothetical protein